MWIVDIDEPVKNVWDTGCSEPFILFAGSRILLPDARGSSMAGPLEVLAQYGAVVLVRCLGVV